MESSDGTSESVRLRSRRSSESSTLRPIRSQLVRPRLGRLLTGPAGAFDDGQLGVRLLLLLDLAAAWDRRLAALKRAAEDPAPDGFGVAGPETAGMKGMERAEVGGPEVGGPADPPSAGDPL